MRQDPHLQIPAPLLTRRQFGAASPPRPGVKAGPRNIEQRNEVRYIVIGALCRDEFEPTHLCCCAAKYADTFFRNAIYHDPSRRSPRATGSTRHARPRSGPHPVAPDAHRWPPFPDPFSGNPFTQQVLMNIELPTDLGDRTATIDHPPSGLYFELRRKRPTSPGHTHILPAEPMAPLSRVSTETGEAQTTSARTTPPRPTSRGP